MARKPLLHAFFHSIASLGYIPIALTSVLLSSSTPFVSPSLPPLAIILIAFIPPLLAFPVLCFSYRFLERFECISLTVQRARTYIMLAGCGLCVLVGTHLVIVYGVGNAHNSVYDRMVYGAPPAGAIAAMQNIRGNMNVVIQPVKPEAIVNLQGIESIQVQQDRNQEQKQEQEQSQQNEEKKNQEQVISNLSAANIPASPLDASVNANIDSIGTQEDPTQEDNLPFPSSIISSFFMALPKAEQGSDLSYIDPLEAILTEVEQITSSASVIPRTVTDVESLRISGNMDTDSIKDTTIVASEPRIWHKRGDIMADSMSDMSSEKTRPMVVPMPTEPGRENGDRRLIVKSPIPMHLYPSAPPSSLIVSPTSPSGPIDQSPSQKLSQDLDLPKQDKRNSMVGQTSLQIEEQNETNHNLNIYQMDQNENMAKDSSSEASQLLPPPALHIPQLGPSSITLMRESEQKKEQEMQSLEQQNESIFPWSKLPTYLPPSIAAVVSASATAAAKGHDDPSLYFGHHPNTNRTIGYNLFSIHWLLYIIFQGILISLLIVLFLGVLILTEFVLDREDDDLVQIHSLYWSRVVGIASATIISAVHGSLLSGYVLLEEHTDWIAKASVGAIVVYWCGMTWVMNRVTGPLPY